MNENPKYVVQYMLNTLLCDIRTNGPSMRLIDEQAFDTEEEALKYYNERKNLNRFGAGSNAHVVCYPQFHPNYYPTPVPTSYCDACGEPIYLNEDGEDGSKDLGFTDLPNGNFCSRSCFRNAFSEREDDADYYDEDRYEDDY